MIKSHQVYLDYYGVEPPKGYDIHHIDGNHKNNDPKNLQILLHDEHTRLHHTGKCVSEETRIKKAKAATGRIPSIEARAKRSLALKGRTYSPETIAKMANAAKGRTLTSEHRIKISLALKGRITSKQHRANLSQALKRYSTSMEGKAKLSVAATAHWRNPLYRAKQEASREKRRAACQRSQ